MSSFKSSNSCMSSCIMLTTKQKCPIDQPNQCLADLQQQQQQQATTTQMNLENVTKNDGCEPCTHNGAFVVRAREPRPIQHTQHVRPIFTTFKPTSRPHGTDPFIHTNTHTSSCQNRIHLRVNPPC